MASLKDTSERLHGEVQDFAQRYAHVSAASPAQAAEFEALASQIASFQAEHVAGYRRLVAAWQLGARRAGDTGVEAIVPVPADGFRYTEAYAFSPQAAACRFQTSGTTGNQGGRHYLRTAATYTQLALLGARRVFPWSAERRPLIVALAPSPTGSSSLGFMMQRFMETFDGAALDAERSDRFALDEPGRWLIDAQGVDLEALTRVWSVAHALDAPVWILATSFALVQLFDACDGQRWPLPPGSVVMQTGGFKGRTRELRPDEILGLVTRHFAPSTIVNEYGMTELASQLYNRTELPGASAAGSPHVEPTVFVEPPWLRVIPRDPVTLWPVPDGAVGLANFIDLGNVDSAVSVLTQDLVRREDVGIRLLGRNPGAPLRGCSLALEELAVHGR